MDEPDATGSATSGREAVAVIRPNPLDPARTAAEVAAYKAFCKTTDLSYKERPETGAEDPLDARILSVVAASWRETFVSGT